MLVFILFLVFRLFLFFHLFNYGVNNLADNRYGDHEYHYVVSAVDLQLFILLLHLSSKTIHTKRHEAEADQPYSGRHKRSYPIDAFVVHDDRRDGDEHDDQYDASQCNYFIESGFLIL